MLRKLLDARKLLDEERFGEAVRNLGSILAARDDSFYQRDKNSSISRSLKAEAQRLMAGLPAEGREAYEMQFGAQAGKLLEEALATGNPQGLAEASRRFFWSRSGQQATFLLGQYFLSRGQPLAGALTLRRLQEAGHTADEFEPALSLALATCWLRAGETNEVRRALSRIEQAPAGAGGHDRRP